LVAAGPAAPSATPLTPGFTYQGRLLKNGSPVNATCAMTFRLWDAAAGGVQVGGNQTLASVTVAGGLFTVTLNAGGEFGPNAFTGEARYLETSVTCPGDGAPVVLTRQALTAAPYALYAMGNWGLNGNAGTTEAHVLGTTEKMTFTVVVSGTTAFRLVGRQETALVEFQPSFLGGSWVNTIGPDVHGAFLGGGGRFFNSFAPNSIYDSYSVIAGGIDNEAGTDDGNPNNQTTAFVGAGFSNEAMADFSVVVGGRQNQVAATHGTVGGGQNNAVAVGADYGTIPGGFAAVATQYGQLAHAGGQFNNPGDAQASEFILRNVVNSTTGRQLYLDCNEQTNSNLDTGTPCTSGEVLTIADGRSLAFTIQVVARVVASGNGTLPTDSSVAYFGSGLLENTGGTTTLTLLAALSEIGDAAAATNLSFSLAGAAGGQLTMTADSTQNGPIVRWVAVVRTAEVDN
jgi:hypothetical protein